MRAADATGSAAPAAPSAIAAVAVPARVLLARVFFALVRLAASFGTLAFYRRRARGPPIFGSRVSMPNREVAPTRDRARP
ncbi:hypothetical protein BJF79_26440 [Actinomadura sp. CNU-125]|nr:hypothetical protein BJF79_26440 [Actinomadura sp. CNU-125]